MKFKKAVGALSALAITVSAFAGMAVTANAAETILNNNCSTTDGWVAKSGSVSTESDAEETYVSCYGKGSGNRTAEYTFPENVTSITDGTTTLSFDFYFSDDFGTKNRAVAMISIGDMWSLTSTTWTDTRNDQYYTSDDPDTLLTVSKMQWYTVTATIDMDNDVASVVVKQRGTDNILCLSENIPFAGGLSTLTVQSPRYDSGTRKTYIDNIIVSHEAEKALAKDVVIQYKDGDSVIKTVTNELSGLFVGDDYSYYYPAYVQSDGGEWYKSVSTTYSNSIELNTESVTVDVVYTPVNNTIYFAENEDLENNGDIKESSALSSGKGARVLNAGTEAFTVEESGIYRITIPAYCRNTRNESVYAVYKNSVAEENKIASGDAKGYSQNGPYIGVEENVELNAGDKIIIAGDEGNTSVDYVLAEKTGEIAPPQPVEPEAVAATHSEDFTTEGDCASLWTATLTGVDGLTFDGIKVTAKNSNGEERENSASTTVITGESSIAVYIAVNLAKDTANSKGVTVTDVDAQLVEIK